VKPLSINLFPLSFEGEGDIGGEVSKHSQDEEGFYILICHFDFLCLVFDIVRNLELQPGDCFGTLCLALTERG